MHYVGRVSKHTHTYVSASPHVTAPLRTKTHAYARSEQAKTKSERCEPKKQKVMCKHVSISCEQMRNQRTNVRVKIFAATPRFAAALPTKTCISKMRTKTRLDQLRTKAQAAKKYTSPHSSHRIYSSISLRQSNPPPKCQLIVFYHQFKYHADGFAGELTF